MSAMESTRVVKLKAPITTIFKSTDGERSEVIEEVTLRLVVKAKDLRAMDGRTGEVSQSIALIAQLSGLLFSQVEELQLEDFATLAEIVGELVPDGLKTGQTA